MTEAALFELLNLELRVDSDGSVRYYNALGQTHRVYGPAVEYRDGSRAWYQNDLLHRLDGPAVERSNGSREWWQNGRQYRVDGPAYEDANGSCEWHIKGRKLTEAEWLQQVASTENV